MFMMRPRAEGATLSSLAGMGSSAETSTLTLTPEQIDFFWREGFLVVPRITSNEEVATIRKIYDRLFSRGVGWRDGNQFDFAAPDGNRRAAGLPQILNPSRYVPSLMQTRFRANAEAISTQLLGPGTEWVFDHAMLKPPRHGAETPWHQDRAFHPKGSDLISLTVWMPLQDVSEEMGCLEYVPGSHLGPLHPHRSPGGDDRVHGLEALGYDPSMAVSCPVPAGAAILHHEATLHHAGPNRSRAPRRAYAMAFGVHTGTPLIHEEFPWNMAKKTAAMERKRQAEEAWRKRQANPTLLDQVKRRLRRLI